MGSEIEKDEEYCRQQLIKLGPRSFVGPLKVAKRAGLCHRSYQHYMTLPILAKMIDRNNRLFWLSRLDSRSLNDWHEGLKYGSRTGCRRTYIGCFSYGGQESAAMWKMYCKANQDAVRIMITHEGMRLWSRKLSREKSIKSYWILDGVCKGECKSIQKAWIGDVLYASVKLHDSDPERSNTLLWNGTTKYMDDLREWSRLPNVEGFLKDSEWSYENETRLFVRVRRAYEEAERLAIRVPEEVFSHMSIVLGPWVDASESKEKAKRIQDLFVSNGYRKPYVRQSFLTGALGNWRE